MIVEIGIQRDQRDQRKNPMGNDWREFERKKKKRKPELSQPMTMITTIHVQKISHFSSHFSAHCSKV